MALTPHPLQGGEEYRGGGELSPTITASGEIYRYEGYIEEQEVGDDAEDGR